MMTEVECFSASQEKKEKNTESSVLYIYVLQTHARVEGVSYSRDNM